MAARRNIYLVIKYWSHGWLWLIGMPVTISGPKPPPGKYVIVANHISYLDTVVIFASLPYYFRALGKMEISRIPILGFIYRQIVIMVDRSSEHSRTMSMKAMHGAIKGECSILIFPEGTFNETSAPLKAFYSGAFRLAVNTQTPIFPVLFPDTVHRWHYSAWWKLWPGRNRVVYLPAIPVAGLGNKDIAALQEEVSRVMEAGLMKHSN